MKKINKSVAQKNNEFTIFEWMGEEHQQLVENWDFNNGSITFEGRKKLTQHLLYVQKQTGLPLISQKEIDAIYTCWKEEGYPASRLDMQPKEWKYDGALVFDNAGRINKKRTTLKNTKVFEVMVEWDEDRDEIIRKIKEQEKITGRMFHYAMGSLEIVAGKSINTIQFIVSNLLTEVQRAFGLWPSTELESKILPVPGVLPSALTFDLIYTTF